MFRQNDPLPSKPIEIDASMLDLPDDDSPWPLPPVSEPANQTDEEEQETADNAEVQVDVDNEVQNGALNVESTSKRKARKAWPR
jgi:hypothetical protein